VFSSKVRKILKCLRIQNRCILLLDGLILSWSHKKEHCDNIMTFSAIECRPVVLLIQVILGLEQVGSVNFIDVTRRPTNVLTSSGRFSETCLMNKVTSNYGRSLSEVHVMFCECYFYFYFFMVALCSGPG